MTDYDATQLTTPSDPGMRNKLLRPRVPTGPTSSREVAGAPARSERGTQISLTRNILRLTNTNRAYDSLMNGPKVTYCNRVMLVCLTTRLSISYSTAKHFTCTFKPCTCPLQKIEERTLLLLSRESKILVELYSVLLKSTVQPTANTNPQPHTQTVATDLSSSIHALVTTFSLYWFYVLTP